MPWCKCQCLVSSDAKYVFACCCLMLLLVLLHLELLFWHDRRWRSQKIKKYNDTTIQPQPRTRLPPLTPYQRTQTMKVGSLTAPLLLLVPAAQAFTTPSHFQLATPASNRHKSTFTRLSQSKTTTSTSNPYTSPQLDVAALAKYSIATLTELSLFTATFASLDFVSSTLFHLNPSSLPKALVSFLFYAIALKSRVFNPLNNTRPDRSKARNEEGSNGFRDRVMPSWTPVRNRLLSVFETQIIYHMNQEPTLYLCCLIYALSYDSPALFFPSCGCSS